MAKQDVVNAGVQAIQDAVGGAIGSGYDSGFADGVASVPAAPASPDVDAAVAAQKAQDNQAMADAVAAVQSQLDAMVQKDNADVASIQALQAKLDQIKALLG